MLIKETDIDDGLDIDAVSTVVLLYQHALLTDIVDEAALVIGNQKLRLSACERKRKLNFCKKISESLARFCRDHDEFALRRQNERAAA